MGLEKNTNECFIVIGNKKIKADIKEASNGKRKKLTHMGSNIHENLLNEDMEEFIQSNPLLHNPDYDLYRFEQIPMKEKYKKGYFISQ